MGIGDGVTESEYVMDGWDSALQQVKSVSGLQCMI